jgi:hypothetical protein
MAGTVVMEGIAAVDTVAEATAAAAVAVVIDLPTESCRSYLPSPLLRGFLAK